MLCPSMFITARPLKTVVESESDGRVYYPIHVLCPALIIESHDHAKVVIARVSAQISNFVARLSERIAGASQSNRRNTQYRGIPQLS